MMVNMEVNCRVNDRRSITRTLFCFRPFFYKTNRSPSSRKRPFAALGHVLGYYLAAARWMGSHPSVYSNHKALSPNKRNLPSLIILLKINRDDWIRRLKRRLNKPSKASLDRNYSFVS